MLKSFNQNVDFVLDRTSVLKQFKRVNLKACTLVVVFALQGCGLIHTAPNDKDALGAIRSLMGYDLFHLPENFIVSEVKVLSCKWQESPQGHICDVNLISTEMPLLGAIKLPMQLRFVKKENQWKAFIL